MRIRNRVIKYLITVWVLLCAMPGSPSVAFFHLNINNGLPESQIISIAQDSTGFIWLASQNKLFRYDGSHFKQYSYNLNNPDKSMLPAQKINSLFTDSEGKLWVGAENGIFRYNFHADKFFCLAEEWLNIRVTDFAEDEQRNLWIATDEGLAHFNKTTNKTEWYTDSATIKTNSNNILPEHNLKEVSCAKNGIIWFSTSANKVYRLNTKQKTVADFTKSGDINFQDFSISELQIIGDKIYAGTLSNGLFAVNSENQKITNITFDNLGYNIHDFTYSKDSIIWVATNNGLLKYDLRTNSFTRYTNVPTDPLSLNRTAVNHIFIDKQNNLWISLGIRGVDYGLQNVPFEHLVVGEEEPYTLAFNEVSALNFDHEGNLWVGYESGMVEKHTVSPLTKKAIPLSSGSSEWLPGAVFELFEDSKNRTWMGGWQSGLQKLNAAGAAFSLAEIQPEEMARELAAADIRGITEDEQGNLWIGFHGIGVGKYNPENKKIHLFQFNPDKPAESLSNNFVYNTECDNRGNIWVASSYGISKIDVKTETFTNFYYEENNPESLSNSTVNMVFCDEKGLIWAGTANGLNVYLPGKNAFLPVPIYNEPSARKISGIEQTAPNEIWASTHSGLIKITYNLSSEKDSIEYSSHFFNRKDGLISTNFFDRSVARNSDGNLFFGGNNGIDVIHPNELANFNYSTPPTIITEISTYGQSVYPQIKESSTGTPVLELRPDQRMISFRFTTLDFFTTGQQKYRYKLEGFDKEWVYPQNERVATYTNLNPGEYTFTVQRLNPANESESSQDAIHLKIHTPFWRTLPFYIIVSMLLILVLYFIHHFRNRYVLARQQALTEMIEARTRELQEKNSELDMANQTKNKFFSIISHDLRGPFSALLGILEILADPNNSVNQEKQQQLIKTAKSSAQNTFNLLENLLIWSRTQMKKTTQNPQTNDIIKLINKNIDLTQELLLQKSIELKTFVPQKLEGYFDEDMIDTVIRNILSNAVKFTPKGGNIEIGAEKIHGSEIIVHVADSGIGLTTEEKVHLFDIGKNNKNGTDGEKGTGLGLIICKEFVEKNHGRIWVASNKPTGTILYFTLPVSKN
jgi:signal transduction histidine kinase/ligand-binding sensor domain-containing protein